MSTTFMIQKRAIHLKQLIQNTNKMILSNKNNNKSNNNVKMKNKFSTQGTKVGRLGFRRDLPSLLVNHSIHIFLLFIDCLCTTHHHQECHPFLPLLLVVAAASVVLFVAVEEEEVFRTPYEVSTLILLLLNKLTLSQAEIDDS